MFSFSSGMQKLVFLNLQIHIWSHFEDLSTKL